MSYRDDELLFYKADMHAALESQRRAVASAVEEVSAKRIVDEPIEALVAELAAKLQINLPQLQEAEITVSPPREVSVDVSGDFRRAVYGRGPHMVKGTSVTFSVPFLGDRELFYVRPTTFDSAPPRAKLRGNVLEVTYSGTDLGADDLKRRFAEFLSSVKKYLDWQSQSVTSFNNDLPKIAMERLSARKERLSQANDLVGSLGYKVK